jgi:transcriptional regulator with XRE-family HTH domain
MSLQDLRRAHRLTQARVGKTLNIGQDGVSRLEQRSDLLISTRRTRLGALNVVPSREEVASLIKSAARLRSSGGT